MSENHRKSGERPGDREMVYCPWTVRSEPLMPRTCLDDTCEPGDDHYAHAHTPVCTGCGRNVNVQAVFGS
jgi:hypothetical protein